MTDIQFTNELPTCDILMQLDNMLEGGLENVVIDLACALEKWGYKVAVLVLGSTGEGARKALRRGLRVCVLPYDEQTLLQELRRNPPAIVFAHYSFQGAHLYAGMGIPFIQVLHNVYAWFDDAGKEMFAKAAQHTTLFVAVSETVKEYSVEHLGVATEKCLTIPNGIDLSRYTPEARQEARRLREQFGFSEEEFVFVAVASINRIKRMLALLKSFCCIRDLVPRARLVLLGYPFDKDYLDKLLVYIDKNGLQDRVCYAGHSRMPELHYLMADAFVHASAFEGGQLVLLEALAADLPVVSTDVGFARHFASYPGIRVVDRDFPYTQASFTHAEAFSPSPGLVGDLAWAMLQTCQSGTRPNLPQEVIAAFDVSQTYGCYEQLTANILKRPPQTKLRAGWMELLPESSVSYTALLPSDEEKTLKRAVCAIAGYEAIVAEQNVRLCSLGAEIAALRGSLDGVLQSKSWKITSPLRSAACLFHSIKEYLSL